MRDDRGVSEVVGFVIVFGLIIGSVGILYVSGFGAMNDFREVEQSRNTARALDAMAENFADLARNDGVAGRTSELNLRGGAIQTVEDETNVTVTVSNDTVFDDSIGALTYEHDDRTFAYHGGGVFRATDAGGFALREPSVECTEVDGERRAILSLVVVRGDEVRVIASGGRKITATKRNTIVETGDKVEITVEDGSTYDEAWNRTLTDAGWTPTATGDVAFECDADHSVVRITTIRVRHN